MVNYTKKALMQMHKRGNSYRKIGKALNLSKTRIWQICTDYYEKNTFYCKTHKRRYWKQCLLCEVDKQLKGIKTEEDIIKEVKKIKKSDRTKVAVWKRKILATKLKDRYNWTYLKMGKLFGLDYSSVIYLYKKYKTEIK